MGFGSKGFITAFLPLNPKGFMDKNDSIFNPLIFIFLLYSSSVISGSDFFMR